MELAFETRALRRVCESDAEARRRYPKEMVEELQARLADLRAATSASDLVAGRPSLDGCPPGRIRFSLDGGGELVCVGNHPRPPLTKEDLVDFDRIRRVRVVAIAWERQSG
jgi:toxin HigB-1